MAEGIRARHSRSCRSKTGDNCNCKPTYAAWVWSAREKKKLYKSFATVAAAKAWRVDAASAVRHGRLRSTSALTLREAAEAWLEACERGEILSRHRKPYKPASLRGYRHDLTHYVYEDLGALRLSHVTGDDLQALVDRLVGMGLSGSKVRNVLVPVQALYRRYRRQVLSDPSSGLDLPEPGKRRERVAEPSEAARLIGALPEEDRALWGTAFYAGLRLGELRALRVRNLIDDVNVISVEHGWDVKEGEIEPKSKAGVRQVPSPATLRTLLVGHLRRSGRSASELVFGRTGPAPFTDSHMRKRARTAWASACTCTHPLTEHERRCEATGCDCQEFEALAPIGFHEARHSFSTYLDAAGVSETRADRYMGHSNPSVANRYRHQLPGQLAEDGKTLDAYLTAASAGKVVQIASGARTGALTEQTRMAAEGA